MFSTACMWIQNRHAAFLSLTKLVSARRSLPAESLPRWWSSSRRRVSERIDILYICSNATIAQQNLNRLNVTDQKTSSFATRLTLLPLQLQSLKANGINFVSFTPGTTFDLRSRGGKVEERALIYRMLHGHFGIRSTPLLNLLQATVVSRERWIRWAKEYELLYDEPLAEAFRKSIASDRAFLGKLLAVCHDFRRVKKVRGDLVRRRYEVIGELRRRLADVCIDASGRILSFSTSFSALRTC